MRFRRLVLVVSVAAAAGAPSATSAQQPTVAQFEQVLNTQLQALKPVGYTARTVLFQAARALPQRGRYFPFEVTLTIHDYGPGYPPNRFYGATCVGRMEKWLFDMVKNEASTWIAQGRMTITGSQCKDNPSEGVSAIPLASLEGARASVGTPATPAPTTNSAPTLYIGEFACYGVGNRLMAGMGFHLKPGNKYADLDGGRPGTFEFDATALTITFRSGFLDGQVGRQVKTTGFDLTRTVHCEPWR